MQALGDVSAPAGVAVMQAINLRAINPWFMLVLFGTAATKPDDLGILESSDVGDVLLYL